MYVCCLAVCLSVFWSSFTPGATHLPLLLWASSKLARCGLVVFGFTSPRNTSHHLVDPHSLSIPLASCGIGVSHYEHSPYKMQPIGDGELILRCIK